MSSVIAIDTGSSFQGIHCKQGDLASVGAILHNFYTGTDITKLINAGDLISIDPFIPVTGKGFKTFSSLADLRWNFIKCEIAYLWRNSTWLVSKRTEGPTEGVYVPLEKALKKIKILL